LQEKAFPFGEGGSPQGLTDEVKTSPTATISQGMIATGNH